MNSTAFFHRDLFRSERLIPGESKRIVVHLHESHPVWLIGRSGDCVPPELKHRAKHYDGPAGLFLALLSIRRTGVGRIVIESPLTVDSIFCALFCTLLDFEIIFQPFAQFTSYVMGRRLFGVNPDVKALDHQTGGQSIQGHGKSVFFKKLTLALMKFCFQLKGAGWIVLSKFEEDEIRRLFPGTANQPFIRVPWAIAEAPSRGNEPDFFRKFPQSEGRIKIVLWSRLDYELKGIDRLLEAVAADQGDRAGRYHLFLIGPDYAGGLVKSEKRIEQLGLARRVTILGPGAYTPGDTSPLATADASILLSRWDGFPRALRESLQLSVPIIAGPETHFSEVIHECQCGEVAENPDDPASVVSAIHRLVDGIECGKYDSRVFDQALDRLQAPHLASRMAAGLARLA